MIQPPSATGRSPARGYWSEDQRYINITEGRERDAEMILTSGQKAAATRKRNYGMKASREYINEMLKELPNVTEEQLLVDLRFYEYLLAYRDMLARKAAAKAAA